MVKNIEKWPTTFQVTKIDDKFSMTVEGSTFQLSLKRYLIAGIVNKIQLKAMVEYKHLNLDSIVEIEKDKKFAVVSLVDEDALRGVYRQFKDTRWAGQYDALCKAVVEACEKVLLP